MQILLHTNAKSERLYQAHIRIPDINYSMFTWYIFPQLVRFKCLCWSGRFPFHCYLKEMWAGGNSWSCSSVLAICYLQMQKTYLLKFRAAVFNDKMITSISSFSRELSHHHLCKEKTVNWMESHRRPKEGHRIPGTGFVSSIYSVSSWGEGSLKDLYTPQKQTYSSISLGLPSLCVHGKLPFKAGIPIRSTLYNLILLVSASAQHPLFNWQLILCSCVSSQQRSSHFLSAALYYNWSWKMRWHIKRIWSGFQIS